MLSSLKMCSGLYHHPSLRLSSAVTWGGKNAVVVVVVVVAGLVGEDADGGQPLDHPAPDVARNDQADWVAVIGLEALAVGLVGDEEVVGWVHRPGQRHGRPVLDQLAPGP